MLIEYFKRIKDVERKSLSSLNKKNKIGTFLIGHHRLEISRKALKRCGLDHFAWVCPSLVLYKKWDKIPLTPTSFF